MKYTDNCPDLPPDVCACRHFNGDTEAEIVQRRLSGAVDRTFYAARLKFVFTSKPIVCLRLKDRVPDSAASFCVYSFTCSCGTRYIGRTTRRLSERVREHHPAWLNTGAIKAIRSAVCSHLVDSNHSVDVKSAFHPIYKVRNRQSRLVKCQILATAEAVSIRIHNPPLCAQKQFVQALKLPWPTSHPPTRAHPLDHLTR